MIARIWRGRTRREDAAEYGEYVRDTGGKAFRTTPGNIASMILQTDRGDVSEHLVISLWESEDAIRAFAGDDVEVAVYYPKDEEFLLEMPERLEHHRVVDFRCVAKEPE